MTAEGFHDALKIGTERRHGLYDLQQRYPPWPIPRHLRRGVLKRLRSAGAAPRRCRSKVRPG